MLINYRQRQTIKSFSACADPKQNMTCMDYNYPINNPNINKQDDISIKAMGNSWWMEFYSWSTNKMHGEEQSVKKTTLPNGPQIYGQIPKA